MLVYSKNGNIFPKKDGIPVIKKYSKVPIFPFLRGERGGFEIMSLIFVPQSPKCMCSLKVNRFVKKNFAVQFPKKEKTAPIDGKYSIGLYFSVSPGWEGGFEIMSLIFVPQSPKSMCSLKVNRFVKKICIAIS